MSNFPEKKYDTLKLTGKTENPNRPGTFHNVALGKATTALGTSDLRQGEGAPRIFRQRAGTRWVMLSPFWGIKGTLALCHPTHHPGVFSSLQFTRKMVSPGDEGDSKLVRP